MNSGQAHNYLKAVLRKVSSGAPRDKDTAFQSGKLLLPAVPAVSTAPATAAVATPATATAAMASATTPITTATAAAPAASTATLSLWPRFIHYQVPPAEILSVQRIDRAIGIFVALHFHEGKTA
jgi:hypothetical protein